MKVIEIFPSLQGEGIMIGTKMVFIRLAGCNLKCPWCDTKYSWGEGKEMSINEITRDVHYYARDIQAKWVCFTGGEPFYQDISHLLDDINLAGYYSTVETNGTIHPLYLSRFDFVSISPKNVEGFDIDNLQGIVDHVKDGQLKFVYTIRNSLDWIQKIVKKVNARNLPVVVQPNGMLPPEKYLDALRYLWKQSQSKWMKYVHFRVIPQLHVMLFGHNKGI